MPESLWILPLLSGYYFLSRYIYKKYKYDRLEPQRLIFDSFIAGTILFLITYIVRIIVSLLFPSLIPNVYNILYKLPIQENQLLWTFVFNFVAVISLTKIVNYIYNKNDYFNWKKPVEKAVDDFGDEIEQLFKETAENENLIQVTLKNNKVYVGFVQYIPPPKESNYLKIIPVISGYRNNKTKKIKFTTDYYDAILLYQSKEEKYNSFQMDITIKQDEILSANVFDFEVYDEFNKKYGSKKKVSTE